MPGWNRDREGSVAISTTWPLPRMAGIPSSNLSGTVIPVSTKLLRSTNDRLEADRRKTTVIGSAEWYYCLALA
jgi:hypothetical protein